MINNIMTGRKVGKTRISRPSTYVLMSAFYVFLYAVMVMYLAVVTPTVKGNVIGVDFGLDFMKVALVAPKKPLEIVTNTASKRKTETAVSFDRGELGVGGDAYAMITRKPGQVFSKLHALIGRHASHPSVVSIVNVSGLPGVQFNTERGGIDLVLSTNDGKEQRYAPEELVALLLVHAQDITRDYVGRDVKDVVLTSPIFWGALERQALVDAAQLAGLNPLAIVDETTAAAVQFTIDYPADNDTNILFYNMGAGSLQVSIVTLSKKMSKNSNVGQLAVKAKAWDETLGGHWFDVALVDLLAESFNDESIFSNHRAMTKLRAHAGKIKQVLSANVEIPVTIEALHKDKDLVLTVTRDMLLKVCKPLIERAMLPIKEALNMANMTIADIDGVEVVGGGVRVPALQEALRNFLKTNSTELDKKAERSEEGGEQGGVGLDIGVHLNGDEAMSLGAAFIGANTSRSFNVRPVGMIDLTPFAVNIKFFSLPKREEASMFSGIFGGGYNTQGDEEKELFRVSPLITSGGSIPFKKSFSFSHDRDLVVELMYDEGQAQLPPSARMPAEIGGTMMLASYHIIGIDDFAKNMTSQGHGTPKVYVRFSCGRMGIPQVISAEAQVDHMVNVTYKESIIVPIENSEEEENREEEGGNNNVEVGDGSAHNNETDDDDVNNEVEGAANPTTGEEGEYGNGTDTNATMDKVKKPKTRVELVTKTKLVKRTIKQPLNVTKTYAGMPLRPMTKEEKNSSREKITAILEADSWRKEKEASKNNLETYILHVRGLLRDHEEMFAVVSKQEERDSIIALAYELEEWLYDDGWDEATEVYRKKQDQLAVPAEALFFRMSEVEVRPAAVAAAKVVVGKILEKVEIWKNTKVHITEQERQDVIDKANEVLAWLNENEAKQAALEYYEDPVFTSKHVEPKLQPLKKFVLRLSKKPAPRKSAKELSKNETNVEFCNSTLNETTEQWQEKSNDVIDEDGEQRSGSTKESEDDNEMEDEEMKGHKETTEEEDDDTVQRNYDDLSDGEL